MQSTGDLDRKYLSLFKKAKEHAKRSYKKRITSMASALLTEKGKIYTGINIKYKSIWNCICAERVAIAKAIEAEDQNLKTIVTVKYFLESDSYEIINMCGESLQTAIHYKALKVFTNKYGVLRIVSVEETFPYLYM